MPKLFAVHGLVFRFVMQHRFKVDQCQGSQVSSLSKQLEKSFEKVEVWFSFGALLKERKFFTVLAVLRM